MKHTDKAIVSDEMALNYHLMHPGGDSAPGDPNVAFCLDGTYHLHYILQHPWKGKRSFSFVHVTSPDLLHWTWQPTKLQPSFTGHGMFSGTGFITKEGKPAAIYAGLSDQRTDLFYQFVMGRDSQREPEVIVVRPGVVVAHAGMDADLSRYVLQ